MQLGDKSIQPEERLIRVCKKELASLTESLYFTSEDDPNLKANFHKKRNLETSDMPLASSLVTPAKIAEADAYIARYMADVRVAVVVAVVVVETRTIAR